MAQSIKFLGTTDEVDVCDCCGKKNLKSTVAISVDDGDAMYYGVVCAARALGSNPKYIRTEAKRADDEKQRAARAAREAVRDAEYVQWACWLLAATGLRGFDGRVDVYGAIQSLGGYTAAKALYNDAKAKGEVK